MWQRFNENKDLLIVAIASFFIGFGAASLVGNDEKRNLSTGSSEGPGIEDITLPPLPFNKDTAGNAMQGGMEVAVSSLGNTLEIENQRAGVSVFVKRVEFPETRWIVLRDVNDDGTLGNILGAGWFPAGAHENVSVPLLRSTVGGEQYRAVLYADTNGNKQFEHKTDEPVKDSKGNTVSVSFSTVASPSGQ
ncbi:MAG: hypothetical protein G01um101470_368 [Parcubacteria group bacterium Gr01-1014_70]|nr:MAG: hypothetical protein G01um101470_368 [Parcubacteria group bacterium Gr01-1014_70]